jgi:biopolymer transport protein ExbD
MPHAKLPRKSTNIDMTAMCDVAFLLLTFFMLATKFKPDEPVVVKTPASISEITLPDRNIMLITLDPKGRIFFSIDDTIIADMPARKSLVKEVNFEKDLKLTDEEIRSFELGPSIGVPFSQLKAFLGAPVPDQKTLETNASGIPADTSVTNPNNELAEWIKCARMINPRLRICIKADGDASYPNVQKVVKTLAGLSIYKFNLITNLKAIPAGTAAYQDVHKVSG